MSRGKSINVAVGSKSCAIIRGLKLSTPPLQYSAYILLGKQIDSGSLLRTGSSNKLVTIPAEFNQKSHK